MLLTALGGKLLQMRKKNCQKRGVLSPCTCGSCIIINHFQIEGLKKKINFVGLPV